MAVEKKLKRAEGRVVSNRKPLPRLPPELIDMIVCNMVDFKLTGKWKMNNTPCLIDKNTHKAALKYMRKHLCVLEGTTSCVPIPPKIIGNAHDFKSFSIKVKWLVKTIGLGECVDWIPTIDLIAQLAIGK